MRPPFLKDSTHEASSCSYSPATTTRTPDAASAAPTSYTDESSGLVYQVLGWEDLVPPEYQVDAILARYQEQFAGFQDGDP